MARLPGAGDVLIGAGLARDAASVKALLAVLLWLGLVAWCTILPTLGLFYIFGWLA